MTTEKKLGIWMDRCRWDLLQDVIDELPLLNDTADYLKQEMKDKLIEHKNYIRKNGIDMPEVRDK